MSAAEFLPERITLPSLRQAAGSCRGCPLYRDATQTVFGEGKAGARVVLVGEQPGDEEDRTGRPFVGPAGRLLDELLGRAGIDRSDAYVTNAVKHFKWTPRGKRRIHAKPSAGEITACRPWLESELGLLRPDALVVLGASAARSLLGPAFRVTRSRGEIFESPWAPITLATLHPSALLRITEEEERQAARLEVTRELALVAAALGRLATG